MRHFIILLVVLALATPALSYGVSMREYNIQLTDKLVQSEALNRELDAKVAHQKEGIKFYWFVIGAFMYHSLHQTHNRDSSPVDDGWKCR